MRITTRSGGCTTTRCDRLEHTRGNGPWDDDLQHIDEVYLSDGDFLVGEADGGIVAMGAIRKKTDDCAELKRMRVHPEHQRLGYGQQMLDALEQRARTFGYRRLCLDTTVQQVAARRRSTPRTVSGRPSGDALDRSRSSSTRRRWAENASRHRLV